MPERNYRRNDKSLQVVVKEIDWRSKEASKKAYQLMYRILGTLQAWDLYSLEQLNEANLALAHLLQKFQPHPDELKPTLRGLIRILGCRELGVEVRH